MKYASLNNSHNNCHSNYTNRMFLEFRNTWSDLLIGVCFLRDACHKLFCVFGDLSGTGTLDAEVTKALELFTATAGLVEGHRIDREDVSNPMSDRNVWNKIVQSIPTERAE